MYIDMNIKVGEVMTDDITSLYTNTIMTSVVDIFNKNRFNHIPILDKHDRPIGIISRHDYNMMQHCFTRFGNLGAGKENFQLFESLLVDDVMTPAPIVLDVEEYLAIANDLFIQKHINSVIITNEGTCVGILTPTDVLVYIRVPGMVIN